MLLIYEVPDTTARAYLQSMSLRANTTCRPMAMTRLCPHIAGRSGHPSTIPPSRQPRSHSHRVESVYLIVLNEDAVRGHTCTCRYRLGTLRSTHAHILLDTSERRMQKSKRRNIKRTTRKLRTYTGRLTAGCAFVGATPEPRKPCTVLHSNVHMCAVAESTCLRITGMQIAF